MRTGLRSYEGWLRSYGALASARVSEDARDGAADPDLPEDAAWWEEYLSEGLVGLPAWEGPPDVEENPMIPTMVAEVAREEESARMLVAELFGALFAESGVRTYAGPVYLQRSEREILEPFFVVALEGRRVRYEGDCLLADLVLPCAAARELESVHYRLASAVERWEATS